MITLNMSHFLNITPELSRDDAGDLVDRLMEELFDLGVDDPSTSLDYGEHLITIELSFTSDRMTEQEMATAARNLVLQARFGAGVPAGVAADHAGLPSRVSPVAVTSDSWDLIAS